MRQAWLQHLWGLVQNKPAGPVSTTDRNLPPVTGETLVGQAKAAGPAWGCLES